MDVLLEKVLDEARSRVAGGKKEDLDFLLLVVGDLSLSVDGLKCSVEGLPKAVKTALETNGQSSADWRTKAAKTVPPVAAGSGLMGLLWAAVEFIKALQG